MRTRFCLITVICFNLVFTPLFSLAADAGAKRGHAHGGTTERPAPATTARRAEPPRAPAPKARAPQLPKLAAGQTATLLPGGRWLVTGGEGADGAPVSSASVADALTGESAGVGGGMRQPRAWHSATVLPDGNVLVFGGLGAGGRVAGEAELFDAETQTFRALPAARLTPRARHTATLLTDGRVLFAGGVSANGRALDTAETWDARAGSASKVGAKLQTARVGHTAELLPDGTVSLWGGTDGGGGVLGGGEVYDPARDSFGRGGQHPGQAGSGAPYLVESSPREGAHSVPSDARLALRFSKPLNVRTVNAETLTLSGPRGAVRARVVAAEGGMLAFVTPARPLEGGAAHALTIEGAADFAGQPLPTSVVSFTTAGGAGHDTDHHAPASPAQTPDPSMSHDHLRMPEGALVPGGGAPDEEEWSPDAGNFGGDWKRKEPPAAARLAAPLQAERGVTAVAGQVLTHKGKPLAKVTVALGGKSTQTDEVGRFLLAEVAPGRHVMVVNGTTASSPNRPFATFDLLVDLRAGTTNVLPFTVWLPIIETRHATRLQVPTRGAVVATTPLIPGLEVHIPAGAMLRYPRGGVLETLTITPIPADRSPLPLPQGLKPRLLFTLQMHGAKPVAASGAKVPGLRIVYPNYGGLAPGTRVPLWDYDSTGRGWYVYGHGEVTKDGRQVVPDRGVELPGMHCYGGFFDFDLSPDGPPPGSDAKDGDPVDLSTGQFIYEQLDFALSDIIPVALKRTYRPNDHGQRPFGHGMTHPYDLVLIGDNGDISPRSGELILPDGGRVRFVRTNPGEAPYILEHTASPTAFNRSKLVWADDRNGWDLKLEDGTTFEFERVVDTLVMWTHSVDVRLTAIVDRHGNRTQIVRNDRRRIDKIITPHGRWLEFTYDTTQNQTHRITEVRDNIGRVVRYAYDANGNLWKVTDAAGGVTEYTYDSSHRMLSVRDARGGVFLTNEYDMAGRVVKQTQADGSTYQFAYTADADGHITRAEVTNPRGVVRRVEFNAAGYPTSETNAAGTPAARTHLYERDAVSNFITSVTGPDGRKVAYTLDDRRNVTGVTYLPGTPAQTSVGYTYEPDSNRVATATDALGRASSFAYDAKGQLVRAEDHTQSATTYEYDARGQLASVTAPPQQRVQYAYEDGVLVAVTDPLGNTGRVYVDGAGRPIKTADPLGVAERVVYDKLNRVVETVDALGARTKFEYDANSNLLKLTDARGGETVYTYDLRDRVTSRRDPLGGVETYAYDANSNLTKVVDRRGKVSVYRYDDFDRLTFEGFGEVVADGVASYESTIAYAYDGGGRLQTATDSQAGTITLAYDDYDRLVSEATTLGSVSYEYDAAGRRTSMAVAGRPPVTYAYDAAGRLGSITQSGLSVSFAYDAAHRQTGVTLPNGVTVEYSYDGGSRLTGITYRRDGVAVGDLTYEYDAVGRRTKVGGSFARTALPQTLGLAAYDEANRLTQREGTALAYDAAGNLTSDGVKTYTWDGRGRLSGLTGGGVTASFAYDAFGRRVSKTVNGQTTSYVYDGRDAVRELSGGAGADLLVGGVDEVFARSDSAGAKSLLHDGLGSTLGLVGAAGVETSYTYEPFGRTSEAGAADANPTRFTGREEDGTGLYYYRARYYSPQLQRFLSEDGFGFSAGDANLYAYVANDPCNRTDPSGHAANLAAQCVIGAAIDGGLYLGGAWLSGTKPDPWDFAKAAAIGCVSGVAGYGLVRGAQRILAGIKKARQAKKLIVIGENMKDRVKPYAKKIGAEIYDGMPNFEKGMEAEALLHNEQFIRQKMSEGYRILDIGPDLARRKAGIPLSDFYKMETRVTNGYAGYIKGFPW